MPELATLFARSRATVRFGMRRFHAYGPAGLSDEPRRGRPRKLGPHGLETMRMRRQDDPQQAGYLATFWTIAMRALAGIHRRGVRLSASARRGIGRELGLRGGRPRLAMPTQGDPAKARNQWLMAQAVVEAGPEAAILYADASRLHLRPLVRAMWHGVGQHVRLPTPGTNVTRALFGALNSRPGPWGYLVRERRRPIDFLACLEHLLGAYPAGPLLLLVDHGSRHTAHAVEAWLAVHPRVQWSDWPTYCSHVNPVECIWLRLKNTLAANRLYGSMKLVLETTEAFFLQMTPEQALRWAAA
jgi:transposase